jgi:hypothetical protein
MLQRVKHALYIKVKLIIQVVTFQKISFIQPHWTQCSKFILCLHKSKHEHMRTAELRRLHKRIRAHLQTVERKGVVPNPWAAELLQGVRYSIKFCSFYFLLNAKKNMQNLFQRFYVIHASLAYIENISFSCLSKWNMLFSLAEKSYLSCLFPDVMSCQFPFSLITLLCFWMKILRFTNRPFLIFFILRVRYTGVP